MTGILLQPCSGKESMKRFEDTISEGINLKDLEGRLDQKTFNLLKEKSGSTVRVWGLIKSDSGTNSSKWNRLMAGDVVLFYKNHCIFYKTEVIAKIINSKLSKKWWGEDKNGNTWELIYFIKEGASIDVEWKPELIGYKPTFIVQGATFFESGSREANSLLDFYLREEEWEYDDDSAIRGETTTTLESKEGRKKQTYITRYERNPKLRETAIQIHGTKCMVCGFDFYEAYGRLGKGFIEVHHTKPLSEVGEEVSVSVEKDLVCLCSNCHRMIHRKKGKVLSLDELREISIKN